MKTTIEWLEHMLSIILNEEEFKKITYTIEQAKEMEKKQIMDAWLITKPTTFNGWKKEFEQYYNETFKNK